MFIEIVLGVWAVVGFLAFLAMVILILLIFLFWFTREAAINYDPIVWDEAQDPGMGAKLLVILDNVLSGMKEHKHRYLFIEQNSYRFNEYLSDPEFFEKYMEILTKHGLNTNANDRPPDFIFY